MESLACRIVHRSCKRQTRRVTSAIAVLGALYYCLEPSQINERTSDALNGFVPTHCRSTNGDTRTGQRGVHTHQPYTLVARAAGANQVSHNDRQVALKTLADSALMRETPTEDVYDAIRTLELAKDREGVSGFEESLTGDWRLVYTTGTKKTEDEVGRINYVPIVAVQRFDMEKKFIRNGVYLGPISIEFEGTLRWIEDRRRMEFDFDEIKICGLSLPLPDVARSLVGMRSSTPYKRQPAFDFVVADGTIVAARGAGGGVALWVKTSLID